MNLKEFKEFTDKNSYYNGAGEKTFNEALYLSMGVSSESGKLMDKFQHIIVGEKQEPMDVVANMSDVLYYLVRLADNMNLTLEDLADVNVSKYAKEQQ